jgi:hypothetical protein
MISFTTQKTMVSLIDDLDGESEADETVEYAVDGGTYEIDLTPEENAEALRETFAPYIAAPGVPAAAPGRRVVAEAAVELGRNRVERCGPEPGSAEGDPRLGQKQRMDGERPRPRPPAEQRRRGVRRCSQVGNSPGTRTDRVVQLVHLHHGAPTAKLVRTVLSGCSGSPCGTVRCRRTPSARIANVGGQPKRRPRVLTAEQKRAWVSRLANDEDARRKDLPDLWAFHARDRGADRVRHSRADGPVRY